MKGFVPTPDHVVDLMIDKLFRSTPPRSDSSVLDPGCGQGAFIEGLLRWCKRLSIPLPHVVGIESDPEHAAIARNRYSGIPQIQIRHTDFLAGVDEGFDYIVGNPPYVGIQALSEVERSTYRSRYSTAQGRFDLYLLFFEQALRLLRPGGRLVFVTPEKFLYVETAKPLRRLMLRYHLEELHFLDESTFPDLVTYPLVSSVVAGPGLNTRVEFRDGSGRTISVANRDSSWLPIVVGAVEESATMRLGDICRRISCGVATGADSVFVVKTDGLDPALGEFARPTLAGRELRPTSALSCKHSLLVPYSDNGALIPEADLGALGQYLRNPSRRDRLLARTCVATKPWYAFHENPPLKDTSSPKILCKDITDSPFFVPDYERIVPRHSVYYIVPRPSVDLHYLAAYLNSFEAGEWLRANCQRAAKGFLRLQSKILHRLPIPREFADLDSISLKAEPQARSA